MGYNIINKYHIRYGEIEMLIDFNELKEIHMPGMNNGTGEMTARMYMDDKGVRGKVILQSQGKEFFTWHGKDFFT